jgi:hypothetical protein
MSVKRHVALVRRSCKYPCLAAHGRRACIPASQATATDVRCCTHLTRRRSAWNREVIKI